MERVTAGVLAVMAVGDDRLCEQRNVRYNH